MTAVHVIVVDAKGRVDRPGGSPVIVRDAVFAAIDEGHTSIVLDIAQIVSIDSLLLGILVQAYTTATNRGANLKLMHISKKVAQLFVITKLDGILKSVDPEPE